MQRITWILTKIFAVFGIVISPDKKHPVHLSALFFIWLGGIVLLMVVASFGMYTYSTSPSFCNSCHIMQPYYKAWETSSHFGKATCVQCHYPPAKDLAEHLWHKFQASAQVVKYVTRTYSSKPFAEIDDASCLRSGCHSTRLLEGKVISKQGIHFDHRPHLSETRRGRKLRCVSCHSQIVVGNHVEVTYSTCFLCHFRGMGEKKDLRPIGGCLGCHDIPEKTFKIGNMTYNHKDFVTKRGVGCENCHLDSVQGEGKASAERCFACHNQPEKLNRYNDITFIHENHVTKHHVACVHCHEEMRHGFGKEQKGLLPATQGEGDHSTTPPMDHPPTLVFDCSFCHEKLHTGQLEMYSGKGSYVNLPDMPSPMYLANVDCIGCHYDEEKKPGSEFKGKTIYASSKSCTKCHGPSFKGIWDEMRKELSQAIEQLEGKIKEGRQTRQASQVSPDVTGEADKLLREAERLVRFVKQSHGEHNIYLSSVALRKSDGKLNQAAEKLGATLPNLEENPLLSGMYCANMCHSMVGVQVPPETVTFSGKKMPHKMHTTMMGCVRCHDIGAHKQVPLRPGVRKEVCSTCHP
ncbi:MAG: NapC/NirT family cytochrome c [Deltaproteobacteria bacterium]|nr:NapC/NirT family cytochrome c [Deltaproteobacteria bacterium]